MIHTGSRGLGHQIASDYLRKMEDAFPEIVAKLEQVVDLYNKKRADDEKVIRKNSILIAAIMRGLKSLEDECKLSKKRNKRR